MDAVIKLGMAAVAFDDFGIVERYVDAAERVAVGQCLSLIGGVAVERRDADGAGLGVVVELAQGIGGMCLLADGGNGVVQSANAFYIV